MLTTSTPPVRRGFLLIDGDGNQVQHKSLVKIRLSSPNEAPYEAGKDFSVVIACEDSSTAPSAGAVLKLVEQILKSDGRLLYQWWNFEVLAISSLREIAAVEASNADMIILDIHVGRELPKTVADWISRWVALRQDQPGALVAVLDSGLNQLEGSQKIISLLDQAAALGYIDFLALKAVNVGTDTEVTRRFGELVRHIRQNAQRWGAKRMDGVRADANQNLPFEKQRPSNSQSFVTAAG